MCGRFAQPRSADDLARIFRARRAIDLDGDRFNVAPTDTVAAVVEYHGERVVDTFRWGLVPFFAQSPRERAPLINARSETAETAPAFRASFGRRRCLVPADAFYEWRRHLDPASGRVRRAEPFAIRLADGEPMGFAGLWAVWRDPPTAQRLYSCTILTTSPNKLVGELHHRMPVIIDRDDWDDWLSPESSRSLVRSLLRPYPSEAMTRYPVSPAVNSVRNQGAELLEPLTGSAASLSTG